MANEPAFVQQPPLENAQAVPRHLGVIMDGNGRWAQARGKPRTEGHKAGVDALGRLIELSARQGIEFVTVYSFSSENWRRPKEEISFLFNLLRRYVASELERFVKNGIRVKVLGEREGLDKTICGLLDQVESRTAGGTRMQLNLAFNYGAKFELASAMRKIARRVASGELAPEAITAEMVGENLYTRDIPDPDLILRTGGEKRLSNFLLWQAAYSEFIFIDQCWPDFDEETFRDVLLEFGQRQRRYGALENR